MITVTIELQGEKTTRRIEGTSTVVGRSRSADIRIDHPSVSGRHARIQIADDGSVEVVDAGSRNGLQVGDAKVDRVAVTDGLAVTIGPARFTFSTGGGLARAESLQRLQLPDPGASGISPPPAPGSGQGTTPALGEDASAPGSRGPSLELALAHAPSPQAPKVLAPSRLARQNAPRRRFTLQTLVAAVTASGSLAISIGLHGFIALLLTVCIYRQITPAQSSPITVTLEPPRSIFKAPPDRKDGDGRGLPDGQVVAKLTPRPAPPDPELAAAEPDFAPDASSLLGAPDVAAAGTRPAAAPEPAISLSKRSAMKKFVKVELVPDDGSWEAAKAGPGAAPNPAAGNRDNPPVDLKPGDDPVDAVRGNLENGQNGGWRTVATMEPGEIAVVTGDYDTVQRVLDKLKLRYTTIEAMKFGGAKLARVKVLILNCPGQLDGSGILKLRSFVEKGGWVVSTDWALSPIKEAFPGFLRNVGLSPETWVPICASEGAKDKPLLKDVFNFTGEAPKWYLEERSYLFKVDDRAKEKVEVLIESAEMKKKYGTECVAATFDYGRGRVLHIVSHLQQVSTDPKAHYAMVQFLANWLIQAAVSRPADEAKK